MAEHAIHPAVTPHGVTRHARSVLGAATVLASALYLLSDVLEAAHGGFFPAQLWLTLLCEAAIPVLIVGVARATAGLGRLGWLGAGLYAYSYLFFSYTVIFALVRDVPDYETLSADLAPWMVIHGAGMVLGGLALGAALLKVSGQPRWPALVLMAGVLLVAATQSAPAGVQIVAAALRDVGFAGLGLGLLAEGRAAHRSTADLREPQLH